jgi:F0F1-type ATP synthase epsilon subunit
MLIVELHLFLWEIFVRFVFFLDEQKIFDGEAAEVSSDSTEGPFTIMDGHVPFMSQIQNSVSFQKKNEVVESYAVKEGFLYTNGEVCFLIGETK